MTTPVRVILCRVGCAPEVRELVADRSGSHLAAMQALVGGAVECISLDDGIDLWSNEDGLDLPLNCVIPARAPEVPDGFEVIEAGDDLARPGELGEWRIHGDFFLARSTADGELQSVTDDDVARWIDLWRASRRAAASQEATAAGGAS